MDIKVLGGGCANCKKLEENVRKALAETGREATVEKVTDLPTIMGYGVMMTPALVVNGEVKLAGKVPTVAQLKEMIGAWQ